MDLAQTAHDPTPRRPSGPSRGSSQVQACVSNFLSILSSRIRKLPILRFLASSLFLVFAIRAGTDATSYPIRLDLTRERIETQDAPEEIWHLQRSTLKQLAAAPASVRLRIPLPTGTPVSATLKRLSVTTNERSTWAGAIEGIPGSQIVLAANSEATAGSILIPGSGRFSLVPTSDAKLRITPNSAGISLPCGTVSTATAESRAALERFRRAAGLQGPPPSQDSSPANTPVQLDLLVAYTSAALSGAGGLPGILAQIDAAVAEANITFQNSLVPVTLRLSQAIHVPYSESGRTDRDLAMLTHVMEEAYEREEYPHDPDEAEETGEEEHEDYGLGGVISARRATRSDLVCLLVEGGDDTAGVANQLWEAKAEFAPRALSVIQRGFLNHFQILAHEIGHNLGCQHERTTTPSKGVFPYSHAVRLTIDGMNYRTVMATLPGITLPNFSNPDVSFLGRPTGIASTESDGADNARSLQVTAPIAARFSDYWLEGPEPMVVALSSPEPGSGFGLNEYAEFEVWTSAGMVVNRVDFYVNNVWVGASTQSPFRFPWTSAKAGNFLITARATTPQGQSAPCAPISIQFSMPPSITLKPPADQGHAWVDQTMDCRVETHDPDGTVIRVEYYADDYRIGVSDTPPFTLSWEPKWAQNYVLTARAIDDTGVARTSNGFPIQVQPSNPSFQLSNSKITSSTVQIPFVGKAGTQCRLESSQDLQHWTLLRIVTLGLTPDWTPEPGTNSPVTFYRLTPIP